MIADNDRSLTLGVGLFETMLAIAGRPVLWDAHLARLVASCAALHLPPPDPAVCRQEAARALAAIPGAARVALRLTWTGGPAGRGLNPPERAHPALIATAAPLGTPPPVLALATSRIRRNPTSPTSRHKTLSYLDNVLARAEALERGADEALLLTVSGEAACVAAGNLFVVEGDRLLTPALACGVLPGITRARILAGAPGFGLQPMETAIAPDRLAAADAVFVTNSLIGAVAVRTVDGRATATPSGAASALLGRDWAADESIVRSEKEGQGSALDGHPSRKRDGNPTLGPSREGVLRTTAPDPHPLK